MELFPDHFARAQLNIPETGNGLPDTVNEALWGLDVYRRMQTADGGIRGGIEQSEHPWAGETSWLESKPVYAYAPDEWCSYLYAGDAARAAIVLKRLKPELAKEYEQSALRAFAFAEGRTQSGQHYAHREVRDRRNNASLELWRLTGDGSYHRIFLETTVFKDAAADVWIWEHHDQRDAAFTYARIDMSGQDAAVKANAKAATVREALAQPVETTGFNWTNLNKWGPVQCGTMTTPRVT
jgi:endoglucanase